MQVVRRGRLCCDGGGREGGRGEGRVGGGGREGGREGGQGEGGREWREGWRQGEGEQGKREEEKQLEETDGSQYCYAQLPVPHALQMHFLGHTRHWLPCMCMILLLFTNACGLELHMTQPWIIQYVCMVGPAQLSKPKPSIPPHLPRPELTGNMRKQTAVGKL